MGLSSKMLNWRKKQFHHPHFGPDFAQLSQNKIFSFYFLLYLHTFFLCR